jgi:dipeptidase E
MKLLLTSNGIANPSIHEALVDLLGKPIAESNALSIPTGIYPFPGGGERAWEAIHGEANSPLCELGWKSLGVLELTALPSIRRESWVPALEETDALLVYGGNVLYLSYWMQESGVADLLPSLENLVYVRVSAGSIATTPYNCDAEWNLRFVPLESDLALGSGRTLGLVDFALWVHLDNPDPIFEANSMANVERWAAACRSRLMRLTTRPPSKCPTAPSKSFPRGTGSCSPLRQQTIEQSTCHRTLASSDAGRRGSPFATAGVREPHVGAIATPADPRR